MFLPENKKYNGIDWNNEYQLKPKFNAIKHFNSPIKIMGFHPLYFSDLVCLEHKRHGY